MGRIAGGYKRWSESTSLKARCFWLVSMKTLPELIHGFDVFTLTSRYEGLSMTLTEAMHAGVPLLVSDVGCASEVVKDERMGFSVGNAVEFITKLRILLEVEDDQALSAAVKARAEDLVLEKSAQAYLKLYEQA